MTFVEHNSALLVLAVCKSFLDATFDLAEGMGLFGSYLQMVASSVIVTRNMRGM